MAVCWCALSSCLFVFSFELSHVVWLPWRAGRYYRWWCAVLPLVSGTTAPSTILPLRDGTRGLSRGRGRFLLPHTHSLRPSLPLSSLTSPREGSGGSSSPWRPSPFPLVESIPTSFSCHGCRYCPSPSLLLSRFQILLLQGNGGCISRFLAKSRLELVGEGN